MTQEEYNNEKRECWDEYTRKCVCEGKNTYGAFIFAFDRAYALGKLQASCEQVKETISQEEIECAAEEFAYNIKIPASLPGALVPFINGLAHDSYLQGALGFLGKQEKDAETVICGWVARDKRGTICLYSECPERFNAPINEWGTDYPLQYYCLSKELFPDLTWDDDPIEVELIIKRKKK